MVKRTSRSGSMLLSATHQAWSGSWTLTSRSTMTSTLASDISPWPHRAFITLYAWPGYCLSIDKQYPRLWKIQSEEHTSELQSPCNLVCRLLLEKKHY